MQPDADSQQDERGGTGEEHDCSEPACFRHGKGKANEAGTYKMCGVVLVAADAARRRLSGALVPVGFAQKLSF